MKCRYLNCARYYERTAVESLCASLTFCGCVTASLNYYSLQVTPCVTAPTLGSITWPQELAFITQIARRKERGEEQCRDHLSRVNIEKIKKFSPRDNFPYSGARALSTIFGRIPTPLSWNKKHCNVLRGRRCQKGFNLYIYVPS